MSAPMWIAVAALWLAGGLTVAGVCGMGRREDRP